MRLNHDIHLGYCTNIHRGETWEETWNGLKNYTLRVKDRVSAGKPYGIGLRLSQQAALELSAPGKIAEFKAWLDANGCYVFTINGFPYGSFHGTRVKEQVFKPDGSTPERLVYTNLLFDILAQLLPPGVSGSVSTLPGSHKTFGVGADELNAIFTNLRLCREHIEKVSVASGHDLHLGLEPEPLGLCHLAIEFEDAQKALDRITGAGIRLSKLHFSSALKLKPTHENIAKLHAFDEPVYFHQVIASYGADEPLRRFKDLPDALQFAQANPNDLGEEWRVHFHIPIHAQPGGGFDSTRDHLIGAMDWLAANPKKCQHIEMETYTWEVLPDEMRSGDVVDQLVKEYEWTLEEMGKRELTVKQA